MPSHLDGTLVSGVDNRPTSHFNQTKQIQLMNRNLILFLTLTALTLTAAAADEPWFDLEKCGFCKEIAKQPGLLEHMKTEYHDTKTGIISVTYIEKDYEGAFAKAQTGIRQVVADKMAGKPVVACKHCAAIGEFYGMGIMPESIRRQRPGGQEKPVLRELSWWMCRTTMVSGAGPLTSESQTGARIQPNNFEFVACRPVTSSMPMGRSCAGAISLVKN